MLVSPKFYAIRIIKNKAKGKRKNEDTKFLLIIITKENRRTKKNMKTKTKK